MLVLLCDSEGKGAREMTFDYTLTADSGVRFGFVPGNEKIVFIKAGLGGDHLGYENKYLRIARRLNTVSGVSVICASNPHDSQSHTERDRAIIEEYIARVGITSPELYFFGHSNGAVKGLELALSGLGFKKMLLVNMPLMINMHKIKRYISALPNTGITLAYGTADASFPYTPFLIGKYANLKILSVTGADHNFGGMCEEFVGLCELLFNG